MGQLCSCHRQAKFDKGHFGARDSAGWKTDANLIRKLRLRYSHLTGGGGPGLPLRDNRPLTLERLPTSGEEAEVAVVDRTHPSSSPSSPTLARAASAPPKPPRMRSMLVNGREQDSTNGKRLDWATSELELRSMSGGDVMLSTSLSTIVADGSDGVEKAGSRSDRRRPDVRTGSVMSSLMRHTCSLLTSSGVRPELLVDFLRRRGVVSEETVAAVRRCTARQTAYELIAEVVATRSETAALSDGLRAAGCDDVADCMEAVESLLQLTVIVLNDVSSTCANDKDSLRDLSSCNTGNNASRTEKSRLRSSVDVDVIYIDPVTGNTLSMDNVEDAASAARVSCLRHRSLYVDPDRLSLPPQPPGPIDRIHDGIPVAAVSFHQVCLSERVADRLADLLLLHRSFRSLTFVKCHRVDACLFRFRQTLAEQKSEAGSQLSRVHIRLSRLDDMNIVTELVAVCSRSLHVLSLTGCSIMSTGCAAVVGSLVVGSRCLYEMDLGFNDVADVAPLADALAANCSLRRLRMRGNAIDAVGAAALFESLRRNYRLELLDISGNPIGERRESRGVGVVKTELWCVLAEALLSNRTLRELNLERCSLGVEACTALGRVLAANTTLRVLDISMNQSVGDVGVALITDGLRRNRRSGVRTLALNMCGIGDVGFRTLLFAIKHGGTSGLRHIKLCYNHIGSKDHTRRTRQVRGTRGMNGIRRASPQRRSTSARFHIGLSETSNSMSWCDKSGGSSAVPRLRTDSAISATDSMVAEELSTAGDLEVQDSSTTRRRPQSVTGMANNAHIDAINEDDQTRSSGNFLVTDDTQMVANGDVGTTASGVAFNQMNGGPVSTSTPTPQERPRAVADGVCSWTAVNEMSLSNELPIFRSNAVSHPEFGRGVNAVLDTPDRWSSVDYGRTTPAWLERTTPTMTDDGHEVDDDDEEQGEVTTYMLLCQVLRANSQLKVLLWGNQQWYCGTCDAADGQQVVTTVVDCDPGEPVIDCSIASGSVDEITANELDRFNSLYSTLPRSYEFVSPVV